MDEMVQANSIQLDNPGKNIVPGGSIQLDSENPMDIFQKSISGFLPDEQAKILDKAGSSLAISSALNLTPSVAWDINDELKGQIKSLTTVNPEAKERITKPDQATHPLVSGYLNTARDISDKTIKDVGGGLMETAGNIFGGMIGTPIAGLAGLAGTLYGAAKEIATGEVAGFSGTEVGVKWMEAVQQMFSVPPTTKTGELGTKIVAWPFNFNHEVWVNAGDQAMNLTGSGTVGAAVQTLGEFATIMIAGKLGADIGGEIKARLPKFEEVQKAADIISKQPPEVQKVVEQVLEQTKDRLAAGEAPKVAAVEGQPIGTGTPEITPITGTGETKVRGLASSVEAKAVENKLTKGFGELPEYQTVNMADQAQKASDLIMKDYEQGKRIAMGDEPPPADVIPEAVFTAVENRAIKEGDVNTLRDLATQSKLTTEATTMGQRIRTLAERDPESPVGAIKDIVSVREKVAESRVKGKDLTKAKQDITNEIRKEIGKTRPTKQSWEEFLLSIQC